MALQNDTNMMNIFRLVLRKGEDVKTDEYKLI